MGSEVQLGLAAAAGAAFLWAITVTVFTFAARRAGPAVVNTTRLVLAFLLLLVLHAAWTGHPWPTGLGSGRTFWLFLSGVVGFTVADGLGLTSFLHLGPRLGMLIQTLAPAFSVVAAYAFFGERVAWTKLAAMVVTLSGLALVVAQGPDPRQPWAGRLPWKGLLLALGAALGQSAGQILSVKGLEGGVSSLSGNVVRMAGGAAGGALLLAFSGRRADLAAPWRRGATTLQVLSGTVLGVLGGGLLALYALGHAPVGPAATLLSMVPVFLLPITRIWMGEPITLRALAGTALTAVGAAGLFLG